MKGLIPYDTLGMIAETRERELETVEGEAAVYIMSIPVVRPSLMAAFIAYVGDGGRLKAKFAALSRRMSKTKSAVAIARRMVRLMWVLAKRRQSCTPMSPPVNWRESSGTTN
jgi:hypothetical protein